MAGISDKAIKSNYAENKYRFNNGSELASKEFGDGSGLEMYETPYRNFDPQLGVFHQVDPLADITESYSPYSFALNNPISYNDAWGLAPDSAGKPKANTDDVKPMAAAYVTAKKKDCVTCDAVANDFGPAPSSVAAPIKGSSATVPFAVTVSTLGGAAESGITVTGVGTSAALLPFAMLGYGAYSVSQLHLGSPILNVPTSDIRPFSAPLPSGIAISQPTQHSYTYATEPWGEQYTLRALADGLYPVFQWGKGQIGVKQLHRGDIWKIGTTINGTSRYSNSFYNNTGAGLYYEPEFTGPVEQLIFVERFKLLNYIIQNGGNLPPGNTKLQ